MKNNSVSNIRKPVTGSLSFKRTIILSIIMIATIVSLKILSHSEIVQPNKAFSTFPNQIGEWKGKVARFEEKIYDILGVDDSILSNYKTPDGRQVQLYVGFYQSQKEGDLIHSPKNCMPGGGWNIIDTSQVELKIPGSSNQKIKTIKLVLEKGTQRQLALYWFQSRGRFIASEYMQKIYLVLDSIIKRRTDGSFVRLIAPVIVDEAEALKTLKGFTKLLIPILKEYIPQ